MLDYDEDSPEEGELREEPGPRGGRQSNVVSSVLQAVTASPRRDQAPGRAHRSAQDRGTVARRSAPVRAPSLEPGKEHRGGVRFDTVSIGVGGEADEGWQQGVLRKGKYLVDAGVGTRDGNGGSLQAEGVDKKGDKAGEPSGASGTVKEGPESKELKIKKLPYMGVTKPLGAHLMLATKERIWKGEYVEILKLLHREVRAKEGSKEEEYELAKRPKVPLTIENWTSAFLIFASVYCEKFPERSVSLFKYMDVIRKAQITGGGYAWAQYDEFRARMAWDEEAKWGELDTDLWQHTMGAAKSGTTIFTAGGLPIVYKPFQGKPTRGGVDLTSKTSGGAGACWDFNKGLCTREYCRFRHECSQCGGRHPLVKCWGGKPQGGQQWSQASGGSASSHFQGARGGKGTQGPGPKGSYSS